MKKKWEVKYAQYKCGVLNQFRNAKRVLESCETLDQMQTTCDWMGNLSDNWMSGLRKFEKASNKDLDEMIDDLKGSTEMLVNEWQQLCESYAQSIIPPVEEQNKPIVVRGFKRYDEE